jgi:hypothetical protein
MNAGVYNIIIEQGATFELNLEWEFDDGSPVDLTGYQGARMQVRKNFRSLDPVLSLTSDDGDIVLGTTDGTISVKASPQATATIDIPCGVYDLELVDPNGEVVRLIQGQAYISPEVTR